MTTLASSRAAVSEQAQVSPRHYLMCPPTYFTVEYRINPWMNSEGPPVDVALAMRQWQNLVEVYRGLGHRVSLLDAVAGLPDMVFAANGATSVAGRIIGARFAHPQRAAEAEHHLTWHRANAGDLGWQTVATPVHVNEAEGDYAILADQILAGFGFRTDRRAHAELAELTGLPVVSLELVDPYFYHLDTALAVLDDSPGSAQIAYYPAAFSPASQDLLRRSFPGAVLADADAAGVLGLNLVSDGRTVVLPSQACGLAKLLSERGFTVVGVELGELLKGGGSVKCCTQELRAAPRHAATS